MWLIDFHRKKGTKPVQQTAWHRTKWGLLTQDTGMPFLLYPTCSCSPAWITKDWLENLYSQLWQQEGGETRCLLSSTFPGTGLWPAFSFNVPLYYWRLLPRGSHHCVANLTGLLWLHLGLCFIFFIFFFFLLLPPHKNYELIQSTVYSKNWQGRGWGCWRKASLFKIASLLEL